MSEKLKKSKKILFLAPIILFSSIAALVGALFLVPPKNDLVAIIMAAGMFYFAGGVIAFHVLLGRAASLLGSSWVLYGLVPVITWPIGPFISWATLRNKLKDAPNTL